MVPVHLQCIDSRPMSLKPTATPSWQVNTLLASSLKRMSVCGAPIIFADHSVGRWCPCGCTLQDAGGLLPYWRAIPKVPVYSGGLRSVTRLALLRRLMQHFVLLLALYAYIKCSDGRWASRVAALPMHCPPPVQSRSLLLGSLALALLRGALAAPPETSQLCLAS